jgi:hypothetical protein
MQTYEITHIIENEEWERKLTELAQRCRKLNGWTEKELLQFAVTSMPMYRVWLMYLEDIVIDMEQEEKRKGFLEKLLKQKEGNTSV